MKNTEFEVRELTMDEKYQIEGGSEVTDAIWYAIGYAAGSVVKAWHNGGGSGAYHDAMSSSNHGGIR